ncbi:MAG TPA: Hsp70 family protein, partial [Pseudonocardiaceae bacterium]
AEVDAVLLVGGSSRVPLVSQVVSAGLGCPVVVDGDSQVAVAMGAALFARSLDTPEPAESDIDPAPDSAGAGTIAAGPFGESGGLADAQLETPRRPALSAAPLEVPPAERVWRDDSVRRVRRIAVAGGLAVLTAAGVGSAAFLTSHSGPLSPAAAETRPTGVPNPAAPVAPGVPGPATPGPGAPGPGVPGPAAEAGNGGADRADSSGAARTTPPAPKAPRGAAQRGPAAPPNAPAPSWVTHYTWTTRWSSPPPATPDPPTTIRPAPTTTDSPTTTKKPPPTTTAAPSSTTHPPHHRSPHT